MTRHDEATRNRDCECPQAAINEPASIADAEGVVLVGNVIPSGQRRSAAASGLRHKIKAVDEAPRTRSCSIHER